MDAYLPHDWQAIAAVVLLLGLEVGGGYGLNRRPRDRAARWIALLMTIAVTAAVERITAAEPAGVRMIAIIVALLYGMKAIVGVEAGGALAGFLPALVRHAARSLRPRRLRAAPRGKSAPGSGIRSHRHRAAAHPCRRGHLARARIDEQR